MIIRKINLWKPALLSVVFLSFLAYISIRAYKLSFTHDESLSYTIVEGDKAWVGTANHHPLNTLSMFISSVLFGNNEFALRLPNVLSFLLYFVGCFYLFSASRNEWGFILGISLALLNPYLMEFFSIARGYGLSQGFIMVSLFFLIRNGYTYTSFSALIKDFLLSVIFASFAVFSNFSMVNLLICIVLIFVIKLYVFRKEQGTKPRYRLFLYVFILAFSSAYFGIERLILLKKSGQLYHGEATLIDSINSLIQASIYFVESPSNLVLTSITLLILFAFTVGLFLMIAKKGYYTSFSVIITMAIMLIGGLVLENILFGAKYPSQRTALLYMPVINIFLYQFFLFLKEHYRLSKTLYIPAILMVVVLLLANFFVGVNMTHSKEWHYDAHTKEVMEIIQEKTKNSNIKLSVSNDWHFEPTMNYYIKRWKLNLNLANRNGISLDDDFIYRLNDKTKLDGFETLRYYPDTKSELLVKNQKMNNK